MVASPVKSSSMIFYPCVGVSSVASFVSFVFCWWRVDVLKRNSEWTIV